MTENKKKRKSNLTIHVFRHFCRMVSFSHSAQRHTQTDGQTGTGTQTDDRIMRIADHNSPDLHRDAVPESAA